MEVLRFSKQGVFDVYLQSKDIAHSWEKFRGRIAYDKCELTPYHYANYTISTPAVLSLCTLDEHTTELIEEAKTEWKELWPVVYETNRYQLSIRIAKIDEGTLPKVKHPRREIEDLFYYDEDQGTEQVKLVGNLDFLNEPGLFKLAFEYTYEGRRQEVNFAFDVVSPKLDTKNDYKSIIRTVDREYENIVFRYLSLTYQQFEKGRLNNDVVWLNTFESLVEHYIRHLSIIVNQPHTKLKSKTIYAKAERIKRWSNAMAESFFEKEAEGMLETHYFGYEEPITTIDSPEN